MRGATMTCQECGEYFYILAQEIEEEGYRCLCDECEEEKERLASEMS